MFVGIGLVKQGGGQTHSDWLWSRPCSRRQLKYSDPKASDISPERPIWANSGKIRHERH